MVGLALLLLFDPPDLTAKIDRHLERSWRDAAVTPAPLSDDHEFLRRLSLDLRGVIPTVAEIREFAADSRPSKRRAWIDRWLESAEFADTWAERWTVALVGRSLADGETRNPVRRLRGWIREALAANMPFDRFARRLLTTRGPLHLDPAAGFLLSVLFENPENAKEAAVRTSRAFLGMQIRCAECHDHPFDDWTQEDFTKLAAFFSRTRTRLDASRGEDRLSGRLVDGRGGDEEPERYRGVSPVLKGAAAPRGDEPRRAALARILVSDPRFARAVTNRLWGMLLGRGLVHPLDGFTRATRPAPGGLLDELAKEFAAGGFDARSLMRSILASRAYQLTSRDGRDDPVLARVFARVEPAPLRPSQIFESIARVGGFDGEERRERREEFSRRLRPGFRDDEAKERADPTVSQALLTLNGHFVGELTLAREDSPLRRLLERESDPDRRIDELFLAALSRPPDADERARFTRHVSGREDDAYEDVLWALVNSTEFMTRH